jgi:hypothetical protein
MDSGPAPKGASRNDEEFNAGRALGADRLARNDDGLL